MSDRFVNVAFKATAVFFYGFKSDQKSCEWVGFVPCFRALSTSSDEYSTAVQQLSIQEVAPCVTVLCEWLGGRWWTFIALCSNADTFDYN